MQSNNALQCKNFVMPCITMIHQSGSLHTFIAKDQLQSFTPATRSCIFLSGFPALGSGCGKDWNADHELPPGIRYKQSLALINPFLYRVWGVAYPAPAFGSVVCLWGRSKKCERLQGSVKTWRLVYGTLVVDCNSPFCRLAHCLLVSNSQLNTTQWSDVNTRVCQSFYTLWRPEIQLKYRWIITFALVYIVCPLRTRLIEM